MRSYLPNAFLALVLVCGHGCRESREPTTTMKKLFRSEDTPWSNQACDSLVSFRISFLPGNVESLRCDISRGTPALEYCITNLSDSSLSIEPFHHGSLSSNPSLNIESDGKELPPLDLTHKDFLPLRFIDIAPRRSYRDTITSFNYALAPDGIYEVYAVYSSRWGGYIDEREVMHRVLSGRLISNKLSLHAMRAR